jgi:hypothetical protein
MSRLGLKTLSKREAGLCGSKSTKVPEIILQSIVYRHANCRGVPGRAPGGRSYSLLCVAIVNQFRPIPKERVQGLVAWQWQGAYDLASVVHPIDARRKEWNPRSPKWAKILHFAVMPKERVHFWHAS